MSEPPCPKPRMLSDLLALARESLERLEARNREERLIHAVRSLAGSGARVSVEYVPAPPPPWPPAAFVRRAVPVAAADGPACSTTAAPEQDLSAEVVAALLNDAGVPNKRDDAWTAAAIRQRVRRAALSGTTERPIRDPITATLCSARVEGECRFRAAPLAKFLEEWTRQNMETAKRIRAVVASGRAAKKAREQALD